MLGFEFISEYKKMNKMFLSNNLPYFDALTNQTKPGYEYLTDLKKRNKPSLSDTQLLAIYSTITAFDYAKLDSGPKLLVFGIGHDTLFWCKANKNGKTFFFESDEHIIEKYSKDIFEELPNQYTDVNVVGVNYAAQIRYRTEYFIEPWLIDVPAPIEEECYDVILIDGPYGQRNSDPGKMEAAYFSVETAKKCILSKKVNSVFIFVHNAQRVTEKYIIHEYLWEGDVIIRIKSDHGDLIGWKFTMETINDKENFFKKLNRNYS
ncbi:hypothetical protein HDU92_001752 [Lobulomyces angularis]|nr:hypothetical protein HDU92_001752 [Lobulomyces angularis]